MCAFNKLDYDFMVIRLAIALRYVCCHAITSLWAGLNDKKTHTQAQRTQQAIDKLFLLLFVCMLADDANDRRRKCRMRRVRDRRKSVYMGQSRVVYV